MAPRKAPIPPAAQPKHGACFDTWNSSSTGHQRAENKLGGSTGWRQSREMKLSHQFKSEEGGGKLIADTVGAGFDDWDEVKALIPKDVRTRAQLNVGDMLVDKTESMSEEERLMVKRKKEDELKNMPKLRSKGIFEGLVIYINGSTYPLISDHKLKHILAKNGGKVSINLGRRQVTHVILGNPNRGQGVGAGGGLAGGKMEKEIRRIGGCSVKYVGVEWVLESMKAGKRLREAQFSNLKIAAKVQQTVYGMFRKVDSTGTQLHKS